MVAFVAGIDRGVLEIGGSVQLTQGFLFSIEAFFPLSYKVRASRDGLVVIKAGKRGPNCPEPCLVGFHAVIDVIVSNRKIGLIPVAYALRASS